MGLDDITDDGSGTTRKRDIERFRDNTLCPSCGEEGEEVHGYFRCTTDSDSCSVVTFLKSKFRSKVADEVV